MDHPFRSAAIGGFNKQDVLSFLEEQSKQSVQAQQRLQEQLEEANRQLEALGREKADLQGQLAGVRQELEALRESQSGLSAQLSRTEQELSVSRAQGERTAQELEKTRRERDGLQAKLNTALPDAQAYVQIKERTAGVELEAHRRAQAIQDRAEDDAQRVRRKLEQWLQRMEREYDQMRGEVEITVSHAASELDRVRAGLNRVTQLVDSQEEALKGIARAYDETAGPKPEAPMPIPEEE